MAFSGNQRTRFGLAGPSHAYAAFTAKAADVAAPGGQATRWHSQMVSSTFFRVFFVGAVEWLREA